MLKADRWWSGVRFFWVSIWLSIVFDSDPVSEAGLYGLLNMAVQMLGFAPHNNRNAENARPDQLKLILLAVEAVSQPNAPDNIAVL